MIESIVRQAVEDSVREVLEKMFFTETLGASPGAAPAAAAIGARLTFEGETPGSLAVLLTEAAARQVSADFLGEDEADISDQRRNEVVCELANMICGSMLSRVESGATFRLSAPEIVPAEEIRLPAPDSLHYAVELSNGRLAVEVQIGKPV